MTSKPSDLRSRFTADSAGAQARDDLRDTHGVLNAELRADVGDVDLCGALGDAEYVGDGLRGEALGGELRDLALAGTERLPEARKFADRFGLGRFLAASCDGAVDRGEELLVDDGLREEVHRAAPHRLDGHLDVAVGAHEDDGQAVCELDELLVQLHACDARHADVEDAAARHRRVVLLEEGLGARVGLHAPALAFNQELVGLAHAAIVVDDANERDALDGIHVLRF